MKKILILTASPRINGNTNSFTREVAKELDMQECEYEIVNLYDLDIKPCIACRCCQTDWSRVYCAQQDDLTTPRGDEAKCDGAERQPDKNDGGTESLFDKISAADMLILATPIYSWYCTPPMKALLDRCVYAFNKYYDDEAETHQGERGPALWAGKEVALIVTCGYEPEKGADLFEEGIRRYCKHSGLKYKGMLVGRHDGYTKDFMDEAKVARAKAFAVELLSETSQK